MGQVRDSARRDEAAAQESAAVALRYCEAKRAPVRVPARKELLRNRNNRYSAGSVRKDD